MFLNTDYIFFAFLLILLFGTFIVNKYTKNILLSFYISLFKASLFYIYFSFYFDGSLTLRDDWRYLNSAYSLWIKDYSYIFLFENIELFRHMASGPHFLYYLLNIVSFDILGVNYYSPVTFNIIITFITSYYVYLIGLSFLTKNESKYAAIFFVLHWDILTWSSLLNLKDMLVGLLVIIMIYNLIILSKKNFIKPLIFIVIMIILFGTIRFYMPFLILISYCLYLYIVNFFKMSILIRIISILLILALIVFILPYALSVFSSEINRLMQDITNPLFGSIRFFLTPIPFMMDDEYMFLFFSSFFHWYSLPFTIIGGYFIYKENKKYAIFLFSFMLIILFFYGLYAELQGPRHRLLILPYISLLQFAGYMVVFRKLFAKPFYKE